MVAVGKMAWMKIENKSWKKEKMWDDKNKKLEINVQKTK